jgi:hypothetical protein
MAASEIGSFAAIDVEISASHSKLVGFGTNAVADSPNPAVSVKSGQPSGARL